MLPTRSRILAEAINTIHLISIEQQNKKGNTLHTDQSNKQENFKRYFKNSFIFTSTTHPFAKLLQHSKLSYLITPSILFQPVGSMKIKSNEIGHVTGGNLLISPERSSFSSDKDHTLYLIRIMSLYIMNFYVIYLFRLIIWRHKVIASFCHW